MINQEARSALQNLTRPPDFNLKQLFSQIFYWGSLRVFLHKFMHFQFNAPPEEPVFFNKELPMFSLLPFSEKLSVREQPQGTASKSCISWQVEKQHLQHAWGDNRSHFTCLGLKSPLFWNPSTTILLLKRNCWKL